MGIAEGTHKNTLVAGLIAVCIYMALVFAVPHDVPRYQGMETDLVMSYVNGAYRLDNGYELWPDLKAFDIQGIGYPAVMAITGQMFKHMDNRPGWGYWTAAKYISVFAAGSVIVLCFIWLGVGSGLLAALGLGTSSLFFEMTYGACTDIFTVALLLWGAWLLVRGNLLWAAMLYGYACITRYEMMIFLPFALWYIGWRRAAMFVLPLLLLMVINFQFAEFPPQGGTYNMALNYLVDDRGPDAITKTLIDQYTTPWAVLTADIPNTVATIFKNLAVQIGGICMDHVWWIFILGFLMVIWEPSSELRILRWALLAHFVIVAISVSYWSTVRYFLPEIAAITFIGAAVIWRELPLRKSMRVVIVAILLLVNSFSLADNVSARIRQSGRVYEEYGQLLNPDDIVLSVRPMPAFIVGCRWRYWNVDIKDLIGYCRAENINYIFWDGVGLTLRPEYEKDLSLEAHMPGIHPAGYSKFGILYRVMPE